MTVHLVINFLSFSMLDDILRISIMNITTNHTNSYPSWYFFNDFLMIISSIIGILMAFLFIFTIYRLDHPYYSISNLITCNTCLAIGLTSIIMFINAFYALKSDFRGIGYFDSFCILRGTLLKIFNIYMYTSLCLKAFNRLCCIVHYRNAILKSYRCLSIIILFQWLISILLVLIIVITDGITYDWGSHLCIIPLRKTYQFMIMSKFGNKNSIFNKNSLFVFSDYLLYFNFIYIGSLCIYSLLCFTFTFIRTISSKTSICSFTTNSCSSYNDYDSGLFFNFFTNTLVFSWFNSVVFI
jgi:hypothetical protein